jgi:peptidoglycan/xylan/chitin deacetylase (PgdA/CDA1 family)
MYIPILTYHRVIHEEPTQAADPARIAVSAQQFRSHLTLLKRLGYSTLDARTYADRLRQRAPIRRRSVMITFDDGYEDNLTVALPILKDFGFTATVFAVTGHIGGHNAWDGGGLRLLSNEGWKALRREGIDVGAHTVNHPHLPTLPHEEAYREMKESKLQLESLLGETITTLAYPYGETKDSVDDAARLAGFTAAYATDQASPDPTKNIFRIRRIVMFPKTTAAQLAWKIQTIYPYYKDFKRRARKAS